MPIPTRNLPQSISSKECAWALAYIIQTSFQRNTKNIGRPHMKICTCILHQWIKNYKKSERFSYTHPRGLVWNIGYLAIYKFTSSNILFSERFPVSIDISCGFISVDTICNLHKSKNNKTRFNGLLHQDIVLKCHNHPHKLTFKVS